jgi:hypothetical protein
MAWAWLLQTWANGLAQGRQTAKIFHAWNKRDQALGERSVTTTWA